MAVLKGQKACVGILFLALAACDGGTGENGTLGGSMDFLNWSSVPDDATVNLEGTARTAGYTQTLNGNQNGLDGNDDGPVDMAAASAPGSAGMVIVYANGVPTSFSASAGGDTASVTSADGTITNTNPIIAQTTAITDRTRIRTADPKADGFEYQTYGTWVTGLNSGAGTVGAASLGARSTASSAADGTYNGQSVGVAQDQAGTLWETRSNVTVTTSQNFSRATIASSGTTGQQLNGAGAANLGDLDFSSSAAATISSNRFTADITGTAVDGTASGQFYGTAAQEVGGTFSSQSGGWNYVGAYGGK